MTAKSEAPALDPFAGYHLPNLRTIEEPPRPPLGAQLIALKTSARQARPKRSPTAMALVVALHLFALWWLAEHMPAVREFQAAAYNFTFQFRAIPTIRLIDETDQRAQGESAPLALRPTAQLAVLSVDEPKPLEQRITATVPQIKPDLEVREVALPPPVDQERAPDAKERPVVAEVKPTAAPVTAPVQAPKPAPAPVVVEGSAAQPRDEPAAAPKPTPLPLAAPPKPVVAEVVPPPTPAPAPPPAAAPAPPPRPVVLEITLPPAAIPPMPPPLAPPPAPTPTPPAAVAQIPPASTPVAPTPAPKPTPTPTPVATPAPALAAQAPAVPAPSNTVQVIVNVPVPPGGSLPAGLPQGASVGGGSSAGAGGGLAGGGASGAGGAPAGLGSATGGPAGGQPGAGSANRPLNLRLPDLRGPYATPSRQRSLADLANEQLRKANNPTKLEEDVNSAAKAECLADKGAGLLNPLIAAAQALQGKCITR